MLHRLAGFETVGAAHHFGDRAEPERRHDLADLHGDEVHEVDRVLRIAGKALAEFRILRGHAHRAGVQVADAHHDAPERHERRGGEAEFLGAEHRGNHHIATGLQLTIGLHHNAGPEVVQHERLMGFGEAELPRDARVLDRSLRGGTGAAVESGDQHHVGVRLGDTRGDRAHAHFRHQLHADARMDVGVLEVVDELREILNGVDVVMRRGRDESDTRGGVTHLGDPRIHLTAGQLTAFTGLRALRHLDLHFLRVDQVVTGDAEAAGGHLLDGGILGIAVGERDVTFGILAAFTGVGLAADAVHRDRERLVRLLRDRAVAHRTRLETAHDRIHRLHLLDGDGVRRLEVEQSTERGPVLELFVDLLGVILEGVVVAPANRLLELVNGLGIEQVILALATPLVLAAHVERPALRGTIRERAAMTALHFAGDLLHPDALDAGRGPGEVLVHHGFVDADGFEDLRTAVRLDRRDAHF